MQRACAALSKMQRRTGLLLIRVSVAMQSPCPSSRILPPHCCCCCCCCCCRRHKVKITTKYHRSHHINLLLHTKRFAPRAAYAARCACSGRKNSVKRKKRRSILACKCKLATLKCQEPRRHAPGKQPTDATRMMSVPRMYLASC